MTLSFKSGRHGNGEAAHGHAPAWGLWDSLGAAAGVAARMRAHNGRYVPVTTMPVPALTPDARARRRQGAHSSNGSGAYPVQTAKARSTPTHLCDGSPRRGVYAENMTGLRSEMSGLGNGCRGHPLRTTVIGRAARAVERRLVAVCWRVLAEGPAASIGRKHEDLVAGSSCLLQSYLPFPAIWVSVELVVWAEKSRPCRLENDDVLDRRVHRASIRFAGPPPQIHAGKRLVQDEDVGISRLEDR